MARTFTAVYNPYSFDELVKPLAMYASEYRRQEDLMNKAYEEGVIEGTIAEGTKAYQMWEGINNNLREVADELATNGMNPQLNKKINSVARDYRMKSKTLTQANAAYQQERQRRLNAMDTHVFQNNSSLSIDDFLNGQTPDNKGVNLQNLTKEVGTEAAQLASALYSSPDWNNIKTRLGGQVYAIVTPNGAPMDLIQAAMFSDEAYNELMNDSGSKEFKQNLQKYRSVYANALKRVEYDKYDPTDQRRIDEAIRIGMGMGMEQPKTETVANKNYRTSEQIRKNNLEEAEFRFKYNFTGDYGSSNMRIEGETQNYRDLQMAQKGYYPKMDKGQRVTDPTTGQTVYEKVGTSTKTQTGGSTNGQIHGHQHVAISWNSNGFKNIIVDNNKEMSGKESIKYEDLQIDDQQGKNKHILAPEGIINKLKEQGITEENAKYYTFVKDGNTLHALRTDIKNVKEGELQGEEDDENLGL